MKNILIALIIFSFNQVFAKEAESLEKNPAWLKLVFERAELIDQCLEKKDAVCLAKYIKYNEWGFSSSDFKDPKMQKTFW